MSSVFLYFFLLSVYQTFCCAGAVRRTLYMRKETLSEIEKIAVEEEWTESGTHLYQKIV